MRMTTRARYGVRALCHVANRGFASAAQIAAKQSIPSRYLEEIIADLRKAGFVIGKRGPQGGYRLTRSAEEIALADVLGALTTTQDRTARPGDDVSRHVERAIDERFAGAIGALTLADLLDEARAAQRAQAANYVI